MPGPGAVCPCPALPRRAGGPLGALDAASRRSRPRLATSAPGARRNRRLRVNVICQWRALRRPTLTLRGDRFMQSALAPTLTRRWWPQWAALADGGLVVFG